MLLLQRLGALHAALLWLWQALCNLAARCLNKDADSRPTASELLKDPLFKYAHDGKWLAKRLMGAAGGRKVTFKEGGEGSPSSSGSASPHHTAAPVSLLPFFVQIPRAMLRCTPWQPCYIGV